MKRASSPSRSRAPTKARGRTCRTRLPRRSPSCRKVGRTRSRAFADCERPVCGQQTRRHPEERRAEGARLEGWRHARSLLPSFETAVLRHSRRHASAFLELGRRPKAAYAPQDDGEFVEKELAG